MGNTSSFVSSTERRKYVDDILKQELSMMYVGLPEFHDAYFDIPNLETTSKTVFNKCKDGESPLYADGWKGWPSNANQNAVLLWFADLTKKLAAFVEDRTSTTSTTPARRRRPLAQPDMPIEGFTAMRKLDVGFVNDPRATVDSKRHLSQILVPRELKSNLATDKSSAAWFDIGRYAREVLLLLKILAVLFWALPFVDLL